MKKKRHSAHFYQLSFQWMGTHLRKGDWVQPDSERTLDNGGNAPPRVGGGVPVQADQLRHQRVDEHLPHDCRRGQEHHRRPNPRRVLQPNLRLSNCNRLQQLWQLQQRLPSSANRRRWTKIRVSQELLHGQFKYRIFIDGSEKLNVGNLKAVGFENVKVYAANPWFHAQAGAIKNLSINIKGD